MEDGEAIDLVTLRQIATMVDAHLRLGVDCILSDVLGVVTDALDEEDNKLQLEVVLDVFWVDLHLFNELFCQFLVSGNDFLIAGLDRDRFVDTTA